MEIPGKDPGRKPPDGKSLAREKPPYFVSMKRIVRLTPEISQKIAAGEVIERAFSVVKELVENSLDARASEVRVKLREGGKKLIQVIDDGYGMSREDALLCFERHSTSKIFGEEDLDRISTLGFRGEALPSISAVSHVIVKTSESREKKGTQVERKGEKCVGVSDTAYPQGTSVEVRDLFFNIPARKKFLRTDKSELSQIVKYLSAVSLGYPGVSFSLHHGKREVFNYPSVETIKERIYQIYGKNLLERLTEINYEDEGRELYGFISRPPQGRRDRSHQMFFINHRPVKDRILRGALNQAYKRFLEKNTFPEAFLFLFLSPQEVDVNVHPAKAEVRFKDSRSVFRFIYRCLDQALLKEAGMKEVYVSSSKEEAPSKVRDKTQIPMFQPGDREKREETADIPYSEEKKPHPWVLGQFLDSYIVASEEEGLVIVDQHNAHERVLYERYQQIDRERKWPRKLALMPPLLEFTPSQEVSFEENKPLLERIGFGVESMGGRSYALKEFPDIFSVKEASEVFLSLLEEVKEENYQQKKEALIAALACKTAVKAGEKLPFKKMTYLVEELFKTSNPSLCPHGRPVIVRISRKEIEKGLRRD